MLKCLSKPANLETVSVFPVAILKQCRLNESKSRFKTGEREVIHSSLPQSRPATESGRNGFPTSDAQHHAGKTLLQSRGSSDSAACSVVSLPEGSSRAESDFLVVSVCDYHGPRRAMPQ